MFLGASKKTYYPARKKNLLVQPSFLVQNTKRAMGIRFMPGGIALDSWDQVFLTMDTIWSI
jgi:hypothetical protein